MSAEQDALRLFITQSKEHLQQLLNRLQWTEEGVLKQHRVPAKSKESEQQLPPSCMTTPQRSVQLSEDQLQQLLGKQHIETTTIKSVDDLQFSYSTEEKLLLYEHVLERTPRQRESFEENTNFTQLVAETKRAHQKQRRHRKTKPTLHEQLHQLVELQMQAMIKQQRQLLDQEHQRQLLNATYNNRRQRSRSRCRDRSRFREHHKPQQRRQRSRSRSRERHKHQKHRRKRSRSSSPSHSR
ncbi:hypothetical protein KR215_005208, partial [Drosophila sulfurigaster]